MTRFRSVPFRAGRAARPEPVKDVVNIHSAISGLGIASYASSLATGTSRSLVPGMTSNRGSNSTIGLFVCEKLHQLAIAIELRIGESDAERVVVARGNQPTPAEGDRAAAADDVGVLLLEVGTGEQAEPSHVGGASSKVVGTAACRAAESGSPVGATPTPPEAGCLLA